MKIRQGFVSNSSSSSFVIKADLLSEEQICGLMAHCQNPVGEYQDSWDIRVSDSEISGLTIMRNNTPGENDNDIADWLTKNGYPMDKFVWECD